MSIVSTSNRWLNRLYKTVAIILVLLAVAISAFRLFLPYVHHYRIPLQDYLNDRSQTNISIGSLDMTWQRSGPVLLISDVTILDTEHASVAIEKLELQVDFWKTLTQQNLITKNLILTGAQVRVSELWQLTQKNKGTTDTAIEEEANNISTVTNLFVNRINRFSINDSQITIHNKSISRTIGLETLDWLNTGSRHQAKGNVVLNGLSSNTLQLKVDLTGDDSSDLKGEVFLQATHVDITPWLDRVLVLEDDKTKTDINFSAWFKVDESILKSLRINFLDSTMSWFFEKSKQQLSLDAGEVLLERGDEPETLNLYSTPLSLTLNDEPAQSFTVQLSKAIDNFSVYVSEIDLSMLASLTPLIVAEEKTKQLISNMALTGKVADLFVRNTNNDLQVAAHFSHFSNHFSKGIPGLQNVSGELSFVDDYLSIDFNAKQGLLDFDKLFIQPFPYDSLKGRLNVAINNNGWQLNVEELDFLSKEINLSAQVNVDAPVGDDVNLALLANISNGNAGLVGRYLPLPIMSDNLVNYLNDAVVSGRIEDAQVLINGPLNHFPYGDGTGIFVVDAELSNAEFKFVKTWPAINDFVANLNFTNNSMLITGRDGSLTGLNVTGVTAGISNLAKDQTLTVNADIKSTATSNISELMHQSPLKGSVGSTLDFLNIEGNVSGDFHLNLPLNKKVKGVAKAEGTILFDQNTATLKTPNMHFNAVEGSLSFSNDKINTDNLQLTWQGLPIKLDIDGLKKDDYYQTDLSLSALWKEDEWQAHVPQKLLRYAEGQLPWQGNLSLYQHHGGGFSYDADFSSDLVKTELNLPSPYQRNDNHENALSVKVNGRTTQSSITLNYGNKLHFSGVLNHKETAFSRANLTIGEQAMALPGNGFHITTKLAEAEFSQWQPLISDILDSVKQPATNKSVIDNRTPFLAKPKRIRGSIGKLTILGQELNQVSFNLLDKTDWWLLQLNANETRSQTKIYPNWVEQGLDINAEFLHTVYKKSEKGEAVASENNEPDKAENDIIFAHIPPLTFHCDSCSLGLLDLGRVDVKVERTDKDTVSFTQFDATRKNAKLSLSGRWRHNEQDSNTRLTGSISIGDIEKELKAFSFESIVKDSGIEAELNFDWQGGLHDFSIANLNGLYTAKVDDGYLADVSDKAKIFSVLSLQSLVRKLTLDFRDIFSDGMFYSSIEGDYQLSEGVLTTKNTEMNGTAGNLFMTGYTNLVSGELNYDMSYKPELTSSLPVLAWIATLNPMTFLAGVAIDQVIKSQVVSEFNFKLTGTVEKPDFREIDRKSKNISIDTKEVPKEKVKQAESVAEDLLEPTFQDLPEGVFKK